MRRFIVWSAGILLALIVAVVLAFRLSPWPSVAIITYAFSKGDKASEAALEKHVPPGVVTRRDIAYGAGRDETFDLYYQERTSGPEPTIVWVHGGGGLYLNPPEKAIVLCVDEKSQIQALDRTQPGLPMKKGRCGTMTHDYKRNGTTTLFAALELAQGKVVGECYQRHRHQEFLKFLRRLNEEFPGPVPLHLVMDHYGTHNKPEVRAWLQKHGRFRFHFVPTSSSY